MTGRNRRLAYTLPTATTENAPRCPLPLDLIAPRPTSVSSDSEPDSSDDSDSDFMNHTPSPTATLRTSRGKEPHSSDEDESDSEFMNHTSSPATKQRTSQDKEHDAVAAVVMASEAAKNENTKQSYVEKTRRYLV